MTGRTRGLMAFHRARTLIDQLPEDGSMDFYASLMLELPVPRVAMLRRRSMDRAESRRYGNR